MFFPFSFPNIYFPTEVMMNLVRRSAISFRSECYGASKSKLVSDLPEATGIRNSAKKDVATVEDPFDSPTYHIPEKRVTFTKGASYSLVILAGLGVAGAAGYAVFKELLFQSKEYKIFDKALKRIQDDKAWERMEVYIPDRGDYIYVGILFACLTGNSILDK